MTRAATTGQFLATQASRTWSSVALAVLSLLFALTSAATPLLVNYQGLLTSPTGTQVNAPVQMTFRIFDAPTEGTMAWIETQTVSVANGVFNVLLGSVAPLEITFNKPYFLEVQVAAEILTPRSRIAGVPFAGLAHAANCAPGDFIGCYTGPAGSLGVGACKAGTRTCDATAGLYGACAGQVTPTAETYDAIDNDCNGVVDNGVTPNGAACMMPSQCQSGICTNSFCAAAPLPNGSMCSLHAQCQSGYCFLSACALPQANGSACVEPAQCQSNKCIGNVCTP